MAPAVRKEALRRGDRCRRFFANDRLLDEVDLVVPTAFLEPVHQAGDVFPAFVVPAPTELLLRDGAQIPIDIAPRGFQLAELEPGLFLLLRIWVGLPDFFERRVERAAGQRAVRIPLFPPRPPYYPCTHKFKTRVSTI